MIRAIAFSHGDDPALRAGLRPEQLRALDDIAVCGTVACGFHAEVCDHCGDQRLVANTCQNRSCPHCQGRARAEWVEARSAELLPCGYFHAVLTLPPGLRGLAEMFRTVVLGALLRAASDAVDHLCRDPRHLGAEVGQLAVLHTWRRDLGWHPHVHLIITAGGWDAARSRWIPARRQGRQRHAFLLPAVLLRRAFGRRLRRLLLEAYAAGAFATGPAPFFPELASAGGFAAHLDKILTVDPVIRIEPPFGNPQNLLKYLGAYVNRVAISPQRIIAHDPQAGTVTYGWRTNAEPDRPQQATLSATDFLRHFLRHVLPPGFRRIRFRGLWSTAHRERKLAVVQRALGVRPWSRNAEPPPAPPPAPPLAEPPPCPVCGCGHYHRVPGPCIRPPRARRRQQLAALRLAGRIPTPVEAAIPA